MKIAVSTNKGGLEDEVCPVFGRCAKFTVIEIEGKELQNTVFLDNPSFSAGGGAGIKAAQFVVNQGVDTVVSGNFGPNAAAILKQAGIKMVQQLGNVGKVVRKYLDGELKQLDAPTVNDHFGMGRRGCGSHGHGGRGRGGR